MTEDPDRDRLAAAWEVAAKALIRGGHVDEPSTKVQLAATNYYVREDLGRVIADELDAGRASLRMDGETLVLSLAEGVEMAVARVPKRGKIRYL